MDDRTVNPSGIDACSPPEIASKMQRLELERAELQLTSLITLAILAGSFLAFWTAAYKLSMTGADFAHDPTRVFGGLVFSLGLILVVFGGAELVTGYALLVKAVVDCRIAGWQLVKNWMIV
ncbi:MAG: formate/nitrite transporter family protein [Rhizobiaceae bacterium]